jgi:hypothetical protein
MMNLFYYFSSTQALFIIDIYLMKRVTYFRRFKALHVIVYRTVAPYIYICIDSG